MTDPQPITGPELEEMKRLLNEMQSVVSLPAAQKIAQHFPRCLEEIEADKAILHDVFAALTTGRLFVSGDCGDEMLTLIDRIRTSISAP